VTKLPVLIAATDGTVKELLPVRSDCLVTFTALLESYVLSECSAMHDYANILWPVLCAGGKDRCQVNTVRKAAWDFSFRGHFLRGACSVL